MSKQIRVILGVLFFGLVLSFFIQQSRAADNLSTKTKSAAIELNIDALYIPCENPSDPLCVAFPTGGTHPDPNNQNHEILLTSGDLPANTEMYIAACINSSQGTVCTTGNTQLDNLLNSVPGGDMMVKDKSLSFKAVANPVKTDAAGNLSVIVRSFTPQVTSHIFNAYYFEEQNSSPTVYEIGPSVTPPEALHLQTFYEVSPTAKPVKTKPKAVRVRRADQDPKGRTFDTKSLEPVLGVEVSLLDSEKKLHVYKSIVNPQTVKGNGEFNFWVANGVYYLSFQNLPNSHHWPVKMEDVHPNYSLAYYCDPDVKDETSKEVPLYYSQFSIIEYNKLVHCDVPLDPGTNTPYRSDVKTLDYGVNKSSQESVINYSGRVSHPFTKITLTGLSSGKQVTELEADKFGFWQFSLAAASYPLTKDGLPDKVQIKYQKKDLTGQEYFAATEGLTLDPLLRYVEGYAYDKNGKVIPNAEVGIRQQLAEKVVYLTAANAEGLFRIGSQYLPNFPYDLVFTDPKTNESIIDSTTEFTEQNKSYLQGKQLNLLTAENEEAPLSVTKVVAYNSLRTGEVSAQNKAESGAETLETTGNSLFVLIFIAIVLGTAAVLIFFKVFKKSSSTPNL